MAMLQALIKKLLRELNILPIGTPHEYDVWIKTNEKKGLYVNHFSYQPKISVIIPVWNTEEKWLRCAINSVINQVYKNWELCIADGGSSKQHIKPVLEAYAKKDTRIKIKFLSENKGISGNTNEALSLATGEYVGFLDHDDELSINALFEVVSLLNDQKNLDLVYSDNDKIDENGIRRDPFFKPDWSLTTFLSTNYLFHFFVCRKNLVDQVAGLRSEYDGAQDYDLGIRVMEKIESDNNIGHIPKILYHWRTIRTSSASGICAKPYAYSAGKRALQDYLNRNEVPGQVYEVVPGSYGIKFHVKDNFKVGIILISKKTGDLDVIKTVNALRNSSQYKITRFFIPGYVQKVSSEMPVIEYPDTFSELSQKINASSINYLIFIDIDEMNKNYLNSLKPDWIEALLGIFHLGTNGIVGTGSPTFSHITHTVHKPCGPVFCLTSELYLTTILERKIAEWSFDDLQIFLCESAEKRGYQNIYIPDCAENMTSIDKISRYYPDEKNSMLYFRRTRKKEDR